MTKSQPRFAAIKPGRQKAVAAGLFLFALLIPISFARADDPSVFGKEEEQAGGALMGIFYDLTQTQAGKSTGIDDQNYGPVLIDFVKNGWDEDRLSKYYSASRPLFTTQIWIPTIPTLAAPRAFGVEKRAPRATWVIHYKGQVIPPEDGTYRFVGYGDDVMVVAVDKKVVLVSDYTHLDFGIPEGEPAGKNLKAGLWINCRKSQPMDLDVLCCDNGDAAGVCAAYILVEQKEKTYEMADGYRLLPIFQVAPFDTSPLSPSLPYSFKFSRVPALWKAIQ